MGRDEYPALVAAAFDLMNRHSGELDKVKKNSRANSNNRSGVMFAQRGTSNSDSTNSSNTQDPVAGTDGRLLPSIRCYNCQSDGHYAGQCPFEDARQNGGTQGSGFVQFGFCHAQREKNGTGGDFGCVINPNWLLLDTCSTHIVCANVDLVENLATCSEEDVLHIVTNGGSLS